MWNVEKARKSFSYRELKVIVLVLESFFHLVKGHTIKWYTDNQRISGIAEIGSMKTCSVLRYAFSLCACLATSSWKWSGFQDLLMIELIF